MEKLNSFHILQLASIAILLNLAIANPPGNPDISLGLYNSSDKVCILTKANFVDSVVQQNHSTLVEFYNSYCGHCRRFAPSYKQLADNLYSWRDVLPICALDCAVEENNDVCREYEVMAYPSMRYIGPNFQPKAEHYGEPIETQIIDEIRSILAGYMAAENVTDSMSSWPNLKNMTAAEIAKPFDGLNSNYKLIILVYEAENTTVGIETCLRFQRWPAIQIRRVTDIDIVSKIQMHDQNKIATIDRNGDIILYETKNQTVNEYTEIIEGILKEYKFMERPDITTQKTFHESIVDVGKDEQHQAILNEVKTNKHMVYQADLEMAIRTVLHNEIPKKMDISGESLVALQRFLAVLKNYNPLGVNGRMLVNKLYEYVVQYSDRLSGHEFEEELKRTEELFGPIYSSNHFVGCAASRQGLRGYSCSLWQLFHFMSVQASNNNFSNNPLEVLQAMHGYIKNFFGCTDCAEHFQQMASRRKIWNVSSADEAVLWIWAAHNEVNKRLAGDETEDPLFPKIQFPSQSSCKQCYKDSKRKSSESLESNYWKKDAVLSFLKNIHNPQFVSRYSVRREELLEPSLEKIRSKRMVSNIFTDMDMRMGMLLYGFCIVMMVVAFKLFAYKGYRKKPYCHDMLGKV